MGRPFSCRSCCRVVCCQGARSAVTDPFTNRLIHEKSPYLQQHAHNPVDWFPWGDEAFQKAKELDRPIFLSIGAMSWKENLSLMMRSLSSSMILSSASKSIEKNTRKSTASTWTLLKS